MPVGAQEGRHERVNQGPHKPGRLRVVDSRLDAFIGMLFFFEPAGSIPWAVLHIK
jgi:hypothetical protein